jgi:hypothetical protein
MKIDGYDALDSACKKRWCWSPGNYQHRGACGSGGSRNTGMTTRCCLERAYRGCPDPVPEPGAPAPWDEVTPNAIGQRGAACGASAAPTGCASNGDTEDE